MKYNFQIGVSGRLMEECYVHLFCSLMRCGCGSYDKHLFFRICHDTSGNSGLPFSCQAKAFYQLEPTFLGCLQAATCEFVKQLHAGTQAGLNWFK